MMREGTIDFEVPEGFAERLTPELVEASVKTSLVVCAREVALEEGNAEVAGRLSEILGRHLDRLEELGVSDTSGFTVELMVAGNTQG